MKEMFTEWGKKTLYTYLKGLAKYYYVKQEKDYPFIAGIVLGLPSSDKFPYERPFKNRDQLLSRIKGYAFLLGISKFEIDVEGTTVTFDLVGDTLWRSE